MVSNDEGAETGDASIEQSAGHRFPFTGPGAEAPHRPDAMRDPRQHGAGADAEPSLERGAGKMVAEVLPDGRLGRRDIPPATGEDYVVDPIVEGFNAVRSNIKRIAANLKAIKEQHASVRMAPGEDRGEVMANLTLAYRALEDASMRLGKAIQARDGGVSVYDRATTVGA